MEIKDNWYENNHNTNEANIIEEFDSEDDNLSEIADNHNYHYLESAGKEQRLKVLTNFEFQPFLELFHKIEEVCESKGRRRRRKKLSKENQFLMSLTWLKHYPYWEKLGRDFGISETYNIYFIIFIL
ncbi:hypothetical protein M0811_05492 [Anaeramoeba ignava]|uniref:Transposase Helix-turn-helix domain-containing protein n=1 Tax=Anaeramoeba ignava TaxID=1746090 RepID=A0A9Q0RF34_ANAIG|nr:hypothetical protein M0811_05492 [Anaeramoeba ignava]